jgi:hypothetical protein
MKYLNQQLSSCHLTKSYVSHCTQLTTPFNRTSHLEHPNAPFILQKPLDEPGLKLLRDKIWKECEQSARYLKLSN